MDILIDIMGMHVLYSDWEEEKALPYYLLMNYSFTKAQIDDCLCLIIEPKGDLPTLPALKKQIVRLQQVEDIPVVVCMERMSEFRRKSMIEARIPFIVKEKQVYLPFMGTFLQRKADKQEKPIEHLMLSAQLLLMMYLYHMGAEMYLLDAGKRLAYSAMTMTRAAKQLEECGFVNIRKEGVKKVLYSTRSKSEIFSRAEAYLLSPVLKVGYMSKDSSAEGAVLSGVSALAERSMLSPERLQHFAVEQGKIEQSAMQSELVDPIKQVAVEIWRYSPELFSSNQVADPISIALSLADEKDERIESSIEEMLEALWEGKEW